MFRHSWKAPLPLLGKKQEDTQSNSPNCLLDTQATSQTSILTLVPPKGHIFLIKIIQENMNVCQWVPTKSSILFRIFHTSNHYVMHQLIIAPILNKSPLYGIVLRYAEKLNFIMKFLKIKMLSHCQHSLLQSHENCNGEIFGIMCIFFFLKLITRSPFKHIQLFWGYKIMNEQECTTEKSMWQLTIIIIIIFLFLFLFWGATSWVLICTTWFIHPQFRFFYKVSKVIQVTFYLFVRLNIPILYKQLNLN